MSGDINKTSNFKSAKIWIMFRFYVLSFLKNRDTIQGGTLFKEIGYVDLKIAKLGPNLSTYQWDTLYITESALPRLLFWISILFQLKHKPRWFLTIFFFSGIRSRTCCRKDGSVNFKYEYVITVNSDCYGNVKVTKSHTNDYLKTDKSRETKTSRCGGSISCKLPECPGDSKFC